MDLFGQFIKTSKDRKSPPSSEDKSEKGLGVANKPELPATPFTSSEAKP